MWGGSVFGRNWQAKVDVLFVLSGVFDSFRCPLWIQLDKLEVIYNNNNWTYCPPRSVWCPPQNLFSSFPSQSHSVCFLNKNCSRKSLTATNLITSSANSCIFIVRLLITVWIRGSVRLSIYLKKYSAFFLVYVEFQNPYVIPIITSIVNGTFVRNGNEQQICQSVLNIQILNTHCFLSLVCSLSQKSASCFLQ